jgi:hypothetical protein
MSGWSHQPFCKVQWLCWEQKVVALSLFKLIHHATLSGNSWSDYSDDSGLLTKIILQISHNKHVLNEN